MRLYGDKICSFLCLRGKKKVFFTPWLGAKKKLAQGKKTIAPPRYVSSGPSLSRPSQRCRVGTYVDSAYMLSVHNYYKKNNFIACNILYRFPCRFMRCVCGRRQAVEIFACDVCLPCTVNACTHDHQNDMLLEVVCASLIST